MLFSKHQKADKEPFNQMFSGRDLRMLIGPLLIEQLLSITVGMADSIMVSSAGEAAISGVSLVDMINVLIINIFAALATGGAVVSSQLLGAGKKERACKSAVQLLEISLSFSVVIMLFTLALRYQILRLFFGAIEDDVMQNALTYFWISSLSYPFIALYNSCAALFRSMGNSKVSMLTSAGMNVINIAGNAVFVYLFHMGAAGVATASLISRAAAAVVMLALLCRPRHDIHLELRAGLRPDFSMMKEILRIGIPNSLENSLFQLGRVMVVGIISVFGTVQIAANAVANTMDSFGCIPGQALNLAIITVVGRCIGAGEREQARFYTKKLVGITYLATICLNTLLLLFLPLILQVYGTLSAETIQLATLLIFIHNGCAMLLWPTAFTLPNALRAASDVRFTMVVAVFSMVAFRVLFSFVLGSWLGWGALGVWTAMIMDWVFRAGCFLWRYHSGKWLTQKAAV